MKISSSFICETGKVRTINQDAVYSCITDHWGIFIVADGMGGHEEGERASGEVINALRVWVEQLSEVEHIATPELVRQLKKVLADCNDKIKRETAEGMLCGCTLVVMILIRHECIFLTAGDSRCYEIQGEPPSEILVQLTEDDTVGGNGPRKDHLTNAIGVKSPMICRSRILPFYGMHRYLICTDGVYKYCDGIKLLSIMKEITEDDTERLIYELQRYVEQNGARDNFSAFLIWAQS